MRSWLALRVLRLLGWQRFGVVPTAPKFVLLCAPHTSNWDLVFLLLFAWSFGLQLSFMAKHTVFRWPFGWLFRALGGLPIDRRSRHNVVQQMIDAFATRERLALAIPPEGTRSYVPFWKSGFYHIALGANVPVVPTVLDFGTRRGGIVEAIELTGDVKADMDRLRAVYDGAVGKRPEATGPVRLQDEEAPVAPPVATG